MEQNIAKQAVRFNEPIPERIANAPTLRYGLEFYLQAFFDLDSARSSGMNVGRIPWLAIMEYAKYYELNDEQTESLNYYIRAMDVAFLKTKEPDG